MNLGEETSKLQSFRLRFSCGCQLLSGYYFALFASFSAAHITSDDEVAEATSKLSVLLALTMLINNFQAVFSGVAIGCSSQAKVAIVNIVSYYVIGIPVGCVLAFVFKLGVKGLWIRMLAGMAVQVIVRVIITWRINWNEEVNNTTAMRLGRFLHESPKESNQSSDNA